MQMLIYSVSLFCLINALILKIKSHWLAIKFVVVSTSVVITPDIVFFIPVYFENDFFAGLVMALLSIFLMILILIFGIRWALSHSNE